MDRGRRHGPRRSEIHLGLRRPHPARVVPVRRRDANFIARQGTKVPAKARSARRRRERCPGIHEDFDEPLLQGLSIDDLRRGRDLEPNASGDPFSLQKSRGDSKVLDAGVRARAEEGDIDLDPIYVVMLQRTNRSFIGNPFTVDPVNSTAAYLAPSSPVVPMILRITSFAVVRSESVPWMSTRSVSGTRSQSRPEAMTAAVSVAPMPAAKAPTAPTMFVWLSLPMMSSPGCA